MGGVLLSPFPLAIAFITGKEYCIGLCFVSLGPQGVQSRMLMGGAHLVWAGSALKICCVSK